MANSIRLATFFACLAACGAWGPLSHYLFARQSFKDTKWFHDASIKQGCDMPDSFYFSNFGEFPTCTIPILSMHNPVTAGYFVKFALTQNPTSTFNPLSFALGYGSHMIADLVGFFPTGGYLGPTVQSYVTAFPFMTAADALASTLDTLSDSAWATADSSNFVTAAGAFYRSTNPSFPTYSVGDVDNCTMPWQVTQFELTRLSALEVKTTFYQSALVLFDQFNATTFAETLASFMRSDDCIVKSVQYWTTSVLDANTTPEAAFAQTRTFVINLFASGSCTTGSTKR
eukprot:TRINITY_DN10451_c0_g1_i1.p2 TRINITY_DN10451_c0_g1~~TRINITY_DN10451_c0_g1_i1.p2  ORF type:complete len:286 (-),score=92.51 TRINITY_DN10451_c0_g1_i1:2118-2975(-)